MGNLGDFGAITKGQFLARLSLFCLFALHIGLVEFVGVFFELFEVDFLLGFNLAGDVGQGDIDDELPLQSAATNQNRETVATAVREREKHIHLAAADFDREMDAVAELLLAHGATDNHNFIVFSFDDSAVIKRA